MARCPTTHYPVLVFTASGVYRENGLGEGAADSSNRGSGPGVLRERNANPKRIREMAKAKPKSTIMVAGEEGGLVQVQDRRFEHDNWPIRFEVPVEQADTWLQYFTVECAKRGWSSGGMGQLDAAENSGTLVVNPGSSSKPLITVVWERKR